MKAVLDTNILIDYLSGSDQARTELSRYSTPCISIVTWMEVMAGARGMEQEISLRPFLESFELIELSSKVAELAVPLRRSLRLKLPDAIIYASARSVGSMLITRNSEDFDPELPDIRVPYSI